MGRICSEGPLQQCCALVNLDAMVGTKLEEAGLVLTEHYRTGPCSVLGVLQHFPLVLLLHNRSASYRAFISADHCL